MSISSTNRKAGPYAGNDVTVAFPFAFKVFSTADVVVYFTSTDGVESVLVLGTNYSISLNSDQDANPGGTVTLTTALATGTKLTLTSSVAELQPVTLTNQGGFYPKVINNALDRATIQIQQLAEKLGRALVWPISASGASLPSPEAGKFIGWNATADSLVNLSGIAAGDAQAVSFTQAGAGAVTRTAQDKMRDSVSVEDFGAVGDGVTSDRGAFIAAMASLQRGGVVLCGPNKYNLSGGDLLVPSNVTIKGDSPQAGENDLNFDFYEYGTVLIVDGAGGNSIRLQEYSAGVESCYIVRSGMDMAPADSPSLQSQILAFSGTAITIEGTDARLNQLCIVGFNKAIWHKGTALAGYARQRISYILFDCTNGIEIDVSGDLGNIYYCRGFPIYSAFRGGWVTQENNRRIGVAFYAPLTYDWGYWNSCNSFGWSTGFLINSCNNMTITDCGADNFQGVAGDVGFHVTGNCADLKIIGCKSTLETGYKFNFVGHASMSACSAWGCKNHVNVISGDVDSYGSYWTYMAASGATYSWVVGIGAGYVALHGDVLDNGTATYPGDPFSVHETAQVKFRLFGVKYLNAATSQLDQVGSDWKAWTPIFTAGSGTFTAVTLGYARYQTIGKTVNFNVYYTVTNNGTAAIDVRFTLPNMAFQGGACFGRNLNTGKMLQGQIIPSGLNECRHFNYDNTYPVATGNGVLITGTYECL